MQPTLSNQRKVINHLSSGKTLTAPQACRKFGIKNFRATISSIRTLVEKYGNWEINNTDGVYSMNDTHPGDRTYTFNRDGSRSMIA